MNKIEVDADDLKELIETNKNLAKRLKALEVAGATEDEPFRPGLAKKKGARAMHVDLRLVDDKPVIAFANKGTARKPLYVYDAPSPRDRNKNIQFVDLIIEGVEEPVTVEYNAFLNDADRYSVPVIETKVTPWEDEQGRTFVKQVQDYSTVELDTEVDMVVKGDLRVYTVEYKGKKLVVDEKYINM